VGFPPKLIPSNANTIENAGIRNGDQITVEVIPNSNSNVNVISPMKPEPSTIPMANNTTPTSNFNNEFLLTGNGDVLVVRVCTHCLVIFHC